MTVTLINRNGQVATVEIPAATRFLEVYEGVAVANGQPIVRAGLSLDEAVRLALASLPRSPEGVRS